MSALDAEIDWLYQQPLTAFTEERDALARRSGVDGAMIRRLQKPSAAAWAVNQVYWHRRKVFDRLTTASDLVRAAHERRLAGKDSDIALAEASHRAAVIAAVDEARALLQQGGDQASDATLSAVNETFQALMWSALDGRLTRPLKPTGLDAIAALLSGPRREIKPAARVLPIRPSMDSKVATAKREAREHASQVAEVEKALRAARVAEERAGANLRRFSDAFELTTREQAKLETALEKAAAATRERREALNRAREQARAATTERERLEARLASL